VLVSTRLAVIEFRVLGPLEVVRRGFLLEIGGGRKRAVLAVLLLHANEVVSTDRLIDEVWGERAPVTAPKILQGYVSQLRKVLSDEDGGSILITKSPGYVLRLGHGQLDVELFVTLLERGRAALSTGATDDAAALLREALGLWRGPPLADFAFDSFAADKITRLEELRLAAVEERIEADLALGREAELIGELEALIARHPLRERLRAQLMRALYRCDRQSEALEVYQEARRLLVAELGLEPSRRLRELEQAILQQDPSLDGSGLPAEPPNSRPMSDQPALEHQSGSVSWGATASSRRCQACLTTHGGLRTACGHRRRAGDWQESPCRGACQPGDRQGSESALWPMLGGRRRTSLLALGSGDPLLRPRGRRAASPRGARQARRKSRTSSPTSASGFLT
jgi:DNA-binding SARP family transcriptional activator